MLGSFSTPETSPPDPTSDDELARRVQSGCADSYNELDRRFRPRILFVLRRRLGHYADAEDVTQQALLRAFEKIHLYDPKQRFSAWIFTIALRLAAEYHRRSRQPVQDSDEQVKQSIDAAPTPEEAAMNRQLREDLWPIADRVLKPDQWTALWLLYGEGHTTREIQQTMGKTAVSVRVLLYRARKALMPHLKEYVDTVDNDSSSSDKEYKQKNNFDLNSFSQLARDQ